MYLEQGVPCGLSVILWLRTPYGLLVLLCLKAHTCEDLKQAERMQRKIKHCLHAHKHING